MAKKKTPSEKPPRKSKYDITLKLDMTFEEAIKKLANTPIKKNKTK